ncbi:hypothetical protein ACIRST_42190 [Kitasatospora sp. NPDC101447]|uniref:hypothetical protein n=1 Tax=Kitasatospora sp. NPDC101447 TaxID=3364102 RepID=UPI00382D055F
MDDVTDDVTDSVPGAWAGSLSKPKQRRKVAPVVRMGWKVLLVAIGLSAVGLGFFRFVDAFEASGAYRSAPACGSAEAGDVVECVRTESGQVTKKSSSSSDDSVTYLLTISRETAPSGEYDVGGAFYRDVEVGTTVDLKIWKDDVVWVSYHGHQAEQRNMPWWSVFEVALLIGAGTTLLAYRVASADLRAWGWPLLVAVPTAVATGTGCVLLIAYQWPFAVTLTLAIVSWLIAVVIAATAVSEL